MSDDDEKRESKKGKNFILIQLCCHRRFIVRKKLDYSYKLIIANNSFETSYYTFLCQAIALLAYFVAKANEKLKIIFFFYFDIFKLLGGEK